MKVSKVMNGDIEGGGRNEILNYKSQGYFSGIETAMY
jgi:hypothetical protein